MPTVTVPGASNSTVKLSYDTDANAALAQHVANAIAAGLFNNTIVAADTKDGPPPPPPAGKIGELVTSETGTVIVPQGYDYVVDPAKSADIFGNGDANEAVLAGAGDLKFFASAGSGSVIGGGGDDLVNIASSDPGPWLIALGNGDDSVLATGGGNDTISVGDGKDQIQLGNGKTFVTIGGKATVLAGGGAETIDAGASKGHDLIVGGASKLFFVAGGSATVMGGTGSDTVFGGTGKDYFQGGTGGNNVLRAGSGRATLFGGGSGDQLYANGDKGQALHAGGGNETLNGGFASGHDTFYGGSGADQITGGFGKNTFVGGTGAATVNASPVAMNLFDLMKTLGGGSELVTGLTDASQVHIQLLGYGDDEVKYALNHQTTKDGSVTVTLSDQTMITFQNISGLTKDNFTGGGDGDKGKHHT